MGNRRIMKWISIFVSIMCIAVIFASTGFADELNDDRIQQLYINKPDVTVYYRDSSANHNIEAYLDGEQLSHIEDSVFSETGKGIDYYFLLDISGSIRDFSSIKEAILQFRESLRQMDHLILITFGNTVTSVLDGSEDKSTAESIVGNLEANDSTTVIAEAVKTTAGIMERASNPDQIVQTLVIISDGKPDTDHSASIDNAEQVLVTKGIQTYTVAVDNNEGDSKESIEQYRSRFSDLANNTGGLSQTIDSEDPVGSVLKAFQNVEEDLLHANVALFRSSSNIVSHRTEEFILSFPDDGHSDSRNVLVEKHQADSTPPEILSVDSAGPQSIVLKYSEDVEGADNPDNYSVEKEGQTVSVTSVKKNDSGYTLVLSEPFHNGKYVITVSDVTDSSQEQNKLETKFTLEIQDVHPEVLSLQINDTEDGFLIDFSEALTGLEEISHYTISCEEKEQEIKEVVVTENKTGVEVFLKNHLKNLEYTIDLSDIYDAETGKNTLLDERQTIEVKNITEWTLRDQLLKLLRDWLPLVLALVVLIIVIFIIVFTKRLKHRKYVVVNGEVVKESNVNEQLHVEVEPKKQGVPIVMWISNGNDEPKKIERTLDGSLCIGRSSRECDVYCDDPMMSKQHFMLSIENDGYLYITDLESTNGTLINGVRIKEKRKLMPRDEVRAGNLRFYFEPIQAVPRR